MRYLYCFLVFASFANLCYAQSGKEFYSKDFNWTITIPNGFETVSGEDWAKIQNKGAKAVEQTFDEKVVNKAKNIFIFKSDKLNYFEANYQPYDYAVDGDYRETSRMVNEMIYQTFRAQMPDIKIDSATTTTKIDDLDFNTFTLRAVYPNDMVLTVQSFSRLWGKKEFTVNVMYVDKSKGDLMLAAWKKSRFH